MVDPAKRERGLKAAIKNPRVSEQAKQRDREILENEYGEGVADPEYIIPTSGSGGSGIQEDMSSSKSSTKMSKSRSTGAAPSSSSPEHSTTSAFSSGQGMRTKAPPSSSGIMLPEEEAEEMSTSSGMTGGKDTGNV